MTTLGKTLFVALSLAVLIAGTLALRSEPDAAPPTAQLTPAQIAELQPAAKPADPPKAVRAPAGADASEEAEPAEPDLEDGSGS
jgi:hypothetical protein